MSFPTAGTMDSPAGPARSRRPGREIGRRRARWLGPGLRLVLALAVGAGCAAVPVTRLPADRALRVDLAPGELWQLYAQAVEAARQPRPGAISTGLVPLVHSTARLRWDGEGRVLMVTWTKRQFYEASVGRPYTLAHGAVWLTAAPFLRDFCRTLGLSPARLRTRLQQVLGLPPGRDDDAFVQMWVHPRDLFRPCADPEVTDRECTLNLTTQPSPGDGCPWAGAYQAQTSARWVAVTPEHLDWMCDNWRQAFPADPRTGYPWTGLGYTYDWGQPDPVGQSEFVAPRGTTVLVESVTGTDEYCRAP
jgi:hypothetical protein